MNPELLRITIGHTLGQACMTGLRTATPVFALAQQQGASEAGLLLASFSASNLLLSVPMGRLVDRHGLQVPWRLSVWLALAAALTCALLPNLWGMALAGMMAGTSAGLSQLAAQHHAGMSSGDARQRGEAMGWLMLAPAAANLIGPVCAGLLLDHAGTVSADRRSLVAVCVFIAAISVAGLWLVRNIAPIRGETTARTPPGPRDRWALLRNRELRGVLWLSTLTFTCWNAFLLIVPILGHERALSPSMVGLIFGAFSLASAVIRPFLPRLVHGIPSHTSVLTGLLVGAAGFAAFPFMPSAAGYLLCAVLLGLAVGSVLLLLVTMMTEVVPAHLQGEAYGLRLLTFSASNLLMPILLGGAGAAIGATAMFLLTGGVAVAGAALAAKLGRERRD